MVGQVINKYALVAEVAVRDTFPSRAVGARQFQHEELSICYLGPSNHTRLGLGQSR